MNRMAIVIGVAAIATLAGCKDPDYKRTPASSDEVKAVPSEETTQQPEAAPVDEKPSCKCPAGAKHEAPCACGAPDCRCEVVKPQPPPPQPEPEYTVYVVRSGDYLAKISKRYNVTINSIKQLNNLKSDNIRVGQKLKLPGKLDVSEPPAKAKSAAQPSQKAAIKDASTYKGETKEYVVKAGDTLGSIAYGNGCNIRQLKKLNGLTSDTIREGQKLKVPANGKAAAKAQPAKKPAVAEKKPQPATEQKVVEEKPAEPVVAPPQQTVSAGDAPVAPVEAPAEPARTYVVQEGEDMTAVCIRWNVSSSAIRELNNLPDDAQLTAGQVIKLPSEAHQ